ncbi:MAG: glycosyltransferase [Chloroflexi bacterium]|nr:glycosyltransferase [Chloroflexota bacterium]
MPSDLISDNLADNLMESNPLVSIVIPTFNRKRFVCEAIDSCLGQTYHNCEIIVIDDGSTDGTGDHLLAEFGDRIRYIRQENQGPAIARNRGIREARGEYIHFLDADDQLVAHKVETCLRLFLQRTDIDVLHTYYQFVASDGRTHIETSAFPSFSDDIFCELLRLTGNHILISSTMIRTAVLRAIGGFEDDPDFRSAEDWDLFLRLASKHKFYGLNDRLVYRRMHDDMLSDDRLQGALGRLKTVENARHYGWERCMSAEEFDRKLAARHHVVGVNWWKLGNRGKASYHFHRAADLYPREARQRRLFAWFSRFLPHQSMDLTIALARGIKGIVGRADRPKIT